jgi:Flp pilus assembly protein TadG
MGWWRRASGLPDPSSRRPRWGERGASLVEFAMVAPLLVVLLFAIVDFGRAFQTWITLTNAAREGARLGATGADADAIRSRVKTTAPGLGLTDGNISVSYPNGQSTGNSVVVTVNHNLTLITPLGSLISLLGSSGSIGSSFALSSTADMRLE